MTAGGKSTAGAEGHAGGALLPWSLVFGVTWFLGFVLFPSWLLPVSVKARFGFFAFYVVYFGVNTYLVRRWLDADPGTAVRLSSQARLTAVFRQEQLLILLLGVAAALQIYPMTMPVLTLMDEAGHIQYAVGIIRRTDAAFRQLAGVSIYNLARVAVAALVVITLVARAKGFHWADLVRKLALRGRAKLAAWGIGLLVLLGAFYVARGFEFHEGLIREPPVAKIIYIITGSVFGLHGFAFRLAQLGFYLLAAVYLYKLVLMFRGRFAGFIAASVFLFCPVVFYFGNLAELSEGIVFFIAAAMFHLLRYVKERRVPDLVAAFYFASTGFLYKRELLLVFLIFLVFLAIEPQRSLLRRPGFLAKLTWVGLAPVAVVLAIGKAFPTPSATYYRGNLLHWTSAGTALAYFRLMAEQMGYFGFALLLASLGYAVVRRREILSRFALVYFVCFYVFYTTLDYGEAVPRYSMVFYPVIAVMMADFVKYLTDRIGRPAASGVAYACLVGYLGVAGTVLQVPPMDGRYVAYKAMSSRYVPYDKAVAWIGDNLPKGSRLLITMASSPLAFYRDKYGVEMEWVGDIWADPTRQTADNLYSFCVAKRIQYVMFPRGHWLDDAVNEQMVEHLAAGRDQRFEIMKRFTSGANEMLIWAIRSAEHGVSEP